MFTQECDRFNEIEEAMVKLGYVGLFKKRTSWSPDGCATFWKADK
jgi:hypothetical protein